MSDAVTALWIDAACLAWNNNQYADVGIPDVFPTFENLESGKGYWIKTNVDNLALIVPGA